MILDPPSLGSLHVSVTSPSPAVADVMDGANGSDIGIVVVGDTVVGDTVVDVVEDVAGVVEVVEVVPVGGE